MNRKLSVCIVALLSLMGASIMQANLNSYDDYRCTPSLVDNNNYLMRRVRIGFDADLGNNWKGLIVL